MNTKLQSTTLVTREQGRQWEALGSTWRVKLCGHDTGGTFALLEQTVEPGIGIPLHVHAEEDETLYILEGSAELLQTEETIRLECGTTVHLPRGTPHGLTATGDRPCRVLHILSPAGLENYFREIYRQVAQEGDDWEEIVGLSAEYGIRFLP